jgi:hypothetical protein
MQGLGCTLTSYASHASNADIGSKLLVAGPVPSRVALLTGPPPNRLRLISQAPSPRRLQQQLPGIMLGDGAGEVLRR